MSGDCSSCQYLMQSRWAAWCHKAHAPVLAIKECPCPRERSFFEPLDIAEIVRQSQEESA